MTYDDSKADVTALTRATTKRGLSFRAEELSRPVQSAPSSRLVAVGAVLAAICCMTPLLKLAVGWSERISSGRMADEADQVLIRPRDPPTVLPPTTCKRIRMFAYPTGASDIGSML